MARARSWRAGRRLWRRLGDDDPTAAADARAVSSESGRGGAGVQPIAVRSAAARRAPAAGPRRSRSACTPAVRAMLPPASKAALAAAFDAAAAAAPATLGYRPSQFEKHNPALTARC